METVQGIDQVWTGLGDWERSWKDIWDDGVFDDSLTLGWFLAPLTWVIYMGKQRLEGGHSTTPPS